MINIHILLWFLLKSIIFLSKYLCSLESTFIIWVQPYIFLIIRLVYIYNFSLLFLMAEVHNIALSRLR